MTGNLWTALGALNALVAVAGGAFAAHALKERLTPELLAVFETAARYQMFHALGLLALGLGAPGRTGAGGAAGTLLVVGIVLFSGSLYLLALTGVRWLGAITPFGGVAFLAGWGCFAWAALRSAPS